MIKILCIADHKDPLIYSSLIKSRFGDIDLVISAGDLEMDYYGYIASSLNKPLLFIFGNHNLKRIGYYRKEYSKMLYDRLNSSYPSFGSTYIGGKVKRIKKLLIAGLGGSKRYNKGKNQFTEAGMFLYILKLLPGLFINKILFGRFLDILVTHAPPEGINDKKDPCHSGFKIFLWFMRVFKPKYLVHGHVHLYDINKKRREKYYETTIVNAYNHTIINEDFKK